MTRRLAALAFALSLGAAPAPALAAPDPAAIAAAVADPARPQADRDRDALRKPAELLAFAGVKPGFKVGELLPGGGYFTRILAKAVGPTGKVYAYLPSEMPDRYVASFRPVSDDPAYGNVTVVRQPGGAFAPPESLDLVWTSQNYHDMHNDGQTPAALNAAVFKALKPGGVYVVVDHAAAAGTGVTDTGSLHRIDPAAVKSEVLRAGFRFDGESPVLRRPEDPHTDRVFDLHDRTDQFAYRFKKPG